MICIITIFDMSNYGNRFQNYALQQVLKELDNYVITVPDMLPKYYSNLKSAIKHFAGVCYRHLFPTAKNIRYNRFTKFTRTHLSTVPFIHPSLLLKLPNTPAFVVGSDQVWNPHYSHLFVNDTLSFLNNQKGISYSASFGVDELPIEYDSRLTEIKKHFKAVSVREESGKRILAPYVDDVQIHVDPTLLLTREDWKKVMHRPRRFSNGKFIALYFLGELNDNRRSQICKFAKQQGYDIVEFMDKSSIYYSYGPAEFLWVMQHAEAVFTDSFHGCIFSFLFDKPFIVYERDDQHENMSTRIETFLPLFHLEDRAYTGSLPEDLLEHDYSAGYAVLEKERERSFDYLKRNLS